MKKIEEVAVIIQARLSSKRIPKKMLKPFADSSLVDICLEKIKRSKIITKENFYFSVYEDELKQLAQKYDVQVWPRSQESANSEGTPITELFDWWDKLGQQYKYAVVVSACTPLLEIQTVDDFIVEYCNSSCDGMFGVVEKKNYFWNHNLELVTPWPPGHEIMNTKFVKPTYEAAHCLYAGRLDRLGAGQWMGALWNPGEVALYSIPEEEGYDIDYPDQFRVIEALYKQLRLK